MSSVAAAATSAVMAVLTGVPGLPAPQRVNLRAVPEATTQAVNVRPLAAEPGQRGMSGAATSWQISILVECLARVTSAAQAADQAVDAMLQAVCTAIEANPTLGGQSIAAEVERVSYDFDADADKTVCASVTVAVLQAAPNPAIASF